MALLLSGRREIFTDISKITKDNICEVLQSAFVIHEKNRREIEYLKKYERGVQPILDRVKKVRPEINIKAVENHAAEITSFKVGYVFGSPITYVQHARMSTPQSNPEDDDKRISQLNDYMYEENKSSKDQQLGKDILICGVGYRIVLPNKDKNKSSPFRIINLNPKNAFVVKSNDIYKNTLIGVSYSSLKDGRIRVGAYTDKFYYELSGTASQLKIDRIEPQELGSVPIIEYINNDNRQGCFENVISLLDALNIATSDRLNGLAQFVQAILWMNNCELDSEQMEELKDKLGLMTKSEDGKSASVEYLVATLDQSQTQTLVDDMYDKVLQITGTPGREQSTGGNTGQAIMLSNGWTMAEMHAQLLEGLFTASEKQLLAVILRMAENLNIESLKGLRISDIDVKFSRNRTDSLLVKTQGLLNQLQAGVHPLIALSNIGLYTDPQQVWNDSKSYMAKWLYDSEDGEDIANGEETLPNSRRSGGEDNLPNSNSISP